MHIGKFEAKLLFVFFFFLHMEKPSVTAMSVKNTVIIGGGIHGASIAYHLKTLFNIQSTIVEKASAIAPAASGKSGGFLAREWGHGPTVQLHHKSFDLHLELAEKLKIESFRKVGVLSVCGGKRRGNVDVSWLDRLATTSPMDGSAAQVTPLELTQKLVEHSGADVLLNSAVVQVIQSNGKVEEVRLSDGRTIPCDNLVIAAGPWSGVLIQDYFNLACPMQGVKSGSIVFSDCEPIKTEFNALFCEEDRNGCHIEAYPRPDGSLYLCGLGGSEYVSDDQLRPGGKFYNPEAVQADPARVDAALMSFRAMTSLGDPSPAIVQACMRPLHPDALPTMGRITGMENAFVSCGHNCWGILWAPVSGYAMAELIATGSAKIVDLSPFRLERFMASKERRGRKAGVIDLGEQW